MTDREIIELHKNNLRPADIINYCMAHGMKYQESKALVERVITGYLPKRKVVSRGQRTDSENVSQW